MHITGEKDRPPVKVGVAVTGRHSNPKNQIYQNNAALQILQLDYIHPMP